MVHIINYITLEMNLKITLYVFIKYLYGSHF